MYFRILLLKAKGGIFLNKNKLRLLFFILLSLIAIVFTACTEDDSTEKEGKSKEASAIEEADKNSEPEENNEETDQSFETDEMEEETSDPLANLLERAPKVPTDLEEILAYPVGPLAGNGERGTKDPKMNIEEMTDFVKDVLPSIKEDKDDDEAYLDQWNRAFHYLFAEDYPDPKQVVSKMKIDDFGHDDMEDARFQFKDQLNVLVILDVSGSMANEIGGKSMMNIAKDSINDFTSNLPEDVNVGLRVYGHEGKPTGKTKEESCEISELVYDIQPLDKESFQDTIAQFEPTGWTPIGLSLEEAKEDFADFPGEDNTNLVYVVSDGAETCDGDPASAAKELAESDIQSIVNVIGFNVGIEGQSHLRNIADAGGGVYTNAGDEGQLTEAFEQAEEIVKKWEEWKSNQSYEAHEAKSDQRIDRDELFQQWIGLKNDELEHKRKLLMNFREEGYITREAQQYLQGKNKEQRDLYSDLQWDIHDKLTEEIEESYEETMREIDEEYDENIDND